MIIDANQWTAWWSPPRWPATFGRCLGLRNVAVTGFDSLMGAGCGGQIKDVMGLGASAKPAVYRL